MEDARSMPGKVFIPPYKKTKMKAAPLNIIGKLKTIFYYFSPSGEFVELQAKKQASLQTAPPVTDLPSTKNEKQAG